MVLCFRYPSLGSSAGTGALLRFLPKPLSARAAGPLCSEGDWDQGFRQGSGKMERVMGIEPTSSAWEAEVLPLNHTRFQGEENTSNTGVLSSAVSTPGVRGVILRVRNGGFFNTLCALHRSFYFNAAH